MKILYIILSFITLLILASCSSGSLNDIHSMDNGTNMDGATHEESKEVKEKIISTEIEKQKNETLQEVDEESIVGDGAMHTMDDGINMKGATHEESENHVEGDNHEMEDGSEMQGATHSE